MQKETRMHFSRMRTAHSLTIYRSICWGEVCMSCHACPLPHTPPLPCIPTTMHAPYHACLPPCMSPCHACPHHHAHPLPCTLHPPCQACPPAMHTYPPHHACPPATHYPLPMHAPYYAHTCLPCKPPARHAPPPVDRQTPVKT